MSHSSIRQVFLSSAVFLIAMLAVPSPVFSETVKIDIESSDEQRQGVADSSYIAATNELRFLAKDGKAYGSVFLSIDGPELGEVSAALDLAKWLERVAQAATPVSVESENEFAGSIAEIAAGIYIGNTKTAKKLGIFAPAGEGETSVIEARGNAIFIVGKTPAATRIAVGSFLKEFLGIAFVWPGDEGAEWTPQKEIPFPRRVRKEMIPAFPWRHIGVADADWSAHLGFGDVPRFSHNFCNIFTTDIYAKNPELAPTVFGVRRPEFSGGYAPQANLMADKAIPVVLDSARQFFEKTPDAPMFAFGINDTTNWDESAASEDAYGPITYFRNLPNRSDYYYAFVNRVADLFSVDANLADKRIGVIAYMDVQNAPSFPLRKNIVPVLCADRSQWVFPEFKEEDKALIRRWAGSGVSLWGVYDYYYGSPFLFPRLFFAEEAESIKFVYDNGGKIFYAECGPVVPFDAPKIWLASELLRDPSGDPVAILEDYYEKTFGKAAKPMKKFYEFSNEIWKNQGGQSRWIKGWNNENSVEIFPPEKLSAARVFINDALSLFPSEKEENAADALTVRERRIVARIRDVSTALERAEKFTESYFARKTLGNAKMETFEKTTDALRSSAWRYEEIYNDDDYSGGAHRVSISKYLISDPRPAALLRVLDFLNTVEKKEDAELVERGLERIFGRAMRSRVKNDGAALSPVDERLRTILEIVPVMETQPVEREGFEIETFKSYEPGDWRARRNLSYPRGWFCILAAAENLEMAAIETNPKEGKTFLRVSGEAERVELSKRYTVSPQQKILAQVFARGNVSCGSVSYLRIDFFDKYGRVIMRTAESLPVGKTQDWRRLVAVGEAPPQTVYAKISVGVGLQGPEDETDFDDLTVSVF